MPMQIIGDSFGYSMWRIGLVMDPKSKKAKHSFGPCGCDGMDVRIQIYNESVYWPVTEKVTVQWCMNHWI